MFVISDLHVCMYVHVINLVYNLLLYTKINDNQIMSPTIQSLLQQQLQMGQRYCRLLSHN